MPMGGTSTGAACGDVKFWPTSSAPAGWLKANGAAVSRTAYAALFAIIGTTYGAGDGSTTFNLPDMRGEFMRGLDDGRGVDSGRAIGSAQVDSFKSHTHPSPPGGFFWINQAGSVFAPSAGNSIWGAWETGTQGGSETRPRNVAMLSCIKY